MAKKNNKTKVGVRVRPAVLVALKRNFRIFYFNRRTLEFLVYNQYYRNIGKSAISMPLSPSFEIQIDFQVRQEKLSERSPFGLKNG